VKGKRAAEWRLVDEAVPRSEFAARVRERSPLSPDERPAGARARRRARAARAAAHGGRARISLGAARHRARETRRHAHGAGARRRRADDPQAFLAAGSRAWAIAAWRELDDALLHLRFDELEAGVVLLRTEGDPNAVLAVDRTLDRHRRHWLVREILLLQKRVLKRLDLTARTFFALIEPGSAFAGSLLELALAADRSYMLAGGEGRPRSRSRR